MTVLKPIAGIFSVSSIMIWVLNVSAFWRLWHFKHENIFIVNEQLYYLNLYATMCIHSTLVIFSNLLFLCKYNEMGRLMFICGGGAFVWYISSLVVFILNRFLAIHFNIRYIPWLDKRKAKVAIGICFGLGVLGNVLLIYFLDEDFENNYESNSVYLWVSMDYIFILICVIIHIFIAFIIPAVRHHLFYILHVFYFLYAQMK